MTETSALDNLGPHLLGRIRITDARDWTSDRLHGYLDGLQQGDRFSTGLPDPVLTEPLGSAITDSPYFMSWTNFRALWAWIKHHPVTPVPIPVTDGPLWPDSVVLDQGQYGTCVGNGWAGWGDTGPVQDAYDEKAARAIYYDATVADGSPDNPDAPGGGQQGASVRGGAKAMQKRGRLTAYAFTTVLADVSEWLALHGPVVIGIDWTADMFNPDADGLIHATGAVQGGHCVVLRQRLDGTKRTLGRNSWGRGWGVGGDFTIGDTDLARLLGNGGEACLAAEVGAPVAKIALGAAWRPQ